MNIRVEFVGPHLDRDGIRFVLGINDLLTDESHDTATIVWQPIGQLHPTLLEVVVSLSRCAERLTQLGHVEQIVVIVEKLTFAMGSAIEVSPELSSMLSKDRITLIVRAF